MVILWYLALIFWVLVTSSTPVVLPSISNAQDYAELAQQSPSVFRPQSDLLVLGLATGYPWPHLATICVLVVSTRRPFTPQLPLYRPISVSFTIFFGNGARAISPFVFIRSSPSKLFDHTRHNRFH
ncbi:hypothetical protein L218DRAFT_272748 [Marasmius fiardii PR-910]|nr:hypothetical protein L218DRAFT_272748 [Marasmius fiardii PR-910]